MRLRPFSRSDLSSPAPIVCLAASLALITILGWQAVASAIGHRALARRVLRDYADLAAIELIRRGSTFVFTYGFDVAAQALTRAPAAGSVPSRGAIAAALPLQSKRAIELVGEVVRVDTARAEFESSEGTMPASVRIDVMTALRASSPSGAPSRIITVTTDGRTRVFAFANSAPGAGTECLGFEVRLDAVEAWLREFVLREPLLPPALVSRELAQSSLSMTVWLPDGRALLRSSERQPPGDLVAVRPWSDEASRRALPGVTVAGSIDPAAASSLIIGGLPESRVGWLIMLFLVAAALAMTAVVQLRRERALAEIRQDFVTRTSHELRTPVARIRIFAETLLLDRVRSDDERREAAQAIDRAARRLSLLIESVLRFSRLRAPDLGRHVERTDVVAVVREVTDEFETFIGRGHQVVVTGASMADAVIDREALRQALLNLLDNAWKYGGADRPIAVSVSTADCEVWIGVTDAGPGVPERDRERIWEPYVRLDRDRHSSVAGTGIGLAVVRDIVRRHEGRSWVETSDSGGATFVMALPASPPMTTPVPSSP